MKSKIIKGLEIFQGKDSYLKDKRLGEVYGTNTYFSFKPFESLEEWETRKKNLKEQILVSSNLWPMPEKSPLNAKIFDPVVYEDFVVEKVMFESHPNFYVTGNLYRPLNKKGPLPAILNPHGHWTNGRLEHSELVQIPTRCANLAKMGFVAFAYDMIGYLDSKQLKHEGEGLSEELWGMGLFGLQLWNSIRSIDFLQSLPYVDAEKIGCTGASGGGTQTFFLTAIDERIKAAAPVNMISFLMQGGCECENAADLRIGTNNVEIGATIAPRPMLMVACTGDWTKNVPNEEYPAIRSIYKLYNAEDRLRYFYDDAEHNYNKNTREAVYGWFNKVMLGKDEPWTEINIDFEDMGKLRLFPGETPSPFELSEDKLYKYLKEQKLSNINKLQAQSNTCCNSLRTAMKHVLGEMECSESLSAEKVSKFTEDGLQMESMILEAENGSIQIPMVIAGKESSQNSDKILIAIHPQGKRELFENKKLRSRLDEFIAKGYSVAAPDVFLTGEYHKPCCKAGRDYTSIDFFTTFNRTDTALRIQDIISVSRYFQSKGIEVNLLGFEDAGLWCLAAASFLPDIENAWLDMNFFDFDDEDSYIRRFYIPGFIGAGSFKTCMYLASLSKLVLFNAKNKDYFDEILPLIQERSSGNNSNEILILEDGLTLA